MRKKDQEISVVNIEQGRITLSLFGVTPLIMHRISVPAAKELLLPRVRKNRAEMAMTAKHNPIQEYIDSCYLLPEGSATRLALPATAFKSLIASVALDMPGAAKSQIARLTWVEGQWVEIFGIPRIFLQIVRNSDAARTPDVRTRAILPQWACQIAVRFVRPLLSETVVGSLIAAGGIMRGVGDLRPEKGKGIYGQFELVESSNAEWRRIIATQGAAEQQLALDNPEPYDEFSAELLEFWRAEMSRRGLKY